ncbi:hypothetical protein N9595_00035 [Bacteroidia bacterium]|nr:hypothetical protein [Bacteroidia bacterium]
MAQASLAQQKKEKWHPFSNVPDLSFYAEVNGAYQIIAQEVALGLGIKGAVTRNANNAIGFTYGNTINKFAPAFEPDSSVYLKNALIGFYYEYTMKPGKKVHLTFPLAAGVGNVYYDWRDLDPNGAASFPYEEEFYFYRETAVKVEVNLARKWRLNGGLTYAIAPLGFDYKSVTNNDVTGPRFQLGIRFGKFWSAD